MTKKEQDIIDAINMAEREIKEWTEFLRRCKEELEELRKCN